MRCPAIAGGSHDVKETMGSQSQLEALMKDTQLRHADLPLFRFSVPCLDLDIWCASYNWKPS